MTARAAAIRGSKIQRWQIVRRRWNLDNHAAGSHRDVVGPAEHLDRHDAGLGQSTGHSGRR